MLTFMPLTLQDLPRVRPYLQTSATRACDDTVGGTYMWREYFYTEYAVCHDTLILKVRYLLGRTAFSLPLGADVDGGIAAVEKYCRGNRMPLIYCTVVPEDLERLRALYPNLHAEPERDWFDYIYNLDELAALPGKRYHGQRNHRAYFLRAHPDHRFEPLTERNLPDAAALFESIARRVHKDSDLFREEMAKVREVLEHYPLYELPGGILYAGGTPVAFAVGEVVGDTLFVHIERADPACRGAYQMIVSRFAEHFAASGVRFVNREEDVGDPGLRVSKLSYHPCYLLVKYTVNIPLQ